MCSNPIMIDNPYYHLSKVGHNRLHDTSSLKIPIPCGNCPTCVRLRQSYMVQRVQMESLDNHLFFITLTYNNESLPRYKVNDFYLNFANFKHVQNMFKRIRKNYDLPSLSYLVVSEYGGKRHRPHFHMILSYPNSGESYGEIMNLERKLHDIILKEWRVNKGSTRKPIYSPLCDFVVTRRGRTFDCHYINPRASDRGEEDVAFYVSKYILKYSDYVDKLKSALRLNLPFDKFKEMWQIMRPKALISKGFGVGRFHGYRQKKLRIFPNVRNHIRKGIDHSLANSECLYPIFINPVSGQTFPLSPYYRRRFMTLDDAYVFLNVIPILIIMVSNILTNGNPWSTSRS